MSIHNYPYLTWSMMLAVTFWIVFLLDVTQRRMMLYGGLSSALFAIASIVYVPDYWQPIRIASFGVGPEDVIFSFANGGMIWTLSIWPLRRRLSYRLCTRRFSRRFGLCTLLGAIVATIAHHMGINVMSSLICAMVVVGFLLLAHQAKLWPICLAGSLGFLLIYATLIAITVSLYPGFPSQWTHSNLWGPTMWSLPLEEYVWAAGFGAVFPLILAYCSNASIRSVHQYQADPAQPEPHSSSKQGIGNADSGHKQTPDPANLANSVELEPQSKAGKTNYRLTRN